MAATPPATCTRRARVNKVPLVEALADRAAERHSALTLNVHLLNPAVRLYVRTGVRVAGAGRGRFGVPMRRDLGAKKSGLDPSFSARR